jgi:hypothetical protein
MMIARPPTLASPRLDRAAVAGSEPTVEPSMAGLKESDRVWSRPLRQALIEPKAKPPPPSSPPPPPPALPRLAATFVERGRSWGLFVDPGGVQRVRRGGERIGEVEILEVSPGAARLKREQQTFELRVPMRSAGESGRRSTKQ